MEITAHNLAALYVFQRTKAADDIFRLNAEEFKANELAEEMLKALGGHETMRRCEKVAAFLNNVNRLSKKNRSLAEEIFARIGAEDLLM